MKKLLFLFFVGFMACTNTQSTTRYKYLFQRDVYIDETFPSYYFPIIRAALDDWNRETGSAAHFTYRGKTKHRKYKSANDCIDFSNQKLFIIAGDEYYPVFQSYKKILGIKEAPLGLGYYNVIILNIDGVQSFNQIKSITLHELGHTLFLEHSSDPQSIMFPHCNKYCSDYESIILKKDIEAFCKKAYCQ